MYVFVCYSMLLKDKLNLCDAEQLVTARAAYLRKRCIPPVSPTKQNFVSKLSLLLECL